MLSDSNYSIAARRRRRHSRPVAAGTAGANVIGDEFIRQDENKWSGLTVTAVGITGLGRWGR